MNGHAPSQHSLRYEENMVLLDEKSPSDIESEAGRADLASRFHPSSSSTSSPSSSNHDRSLPIPPTLPFSHTSHASHPPKPLSQPSRSLLLRTAIFLLPSFLQPGLSTTPSSRLRLSPTAYLDGMRGLAALFVFLCHYTYTCFVIAHGYGYVPPASFYDPPLPPPDFDFDSSPQAEAEYHHHPPTSPTPNNFTLLKLPFIRLFYSGPPMVCVFFIISGYALSLKLFILIRSRQFSGLSQTLSSLIFRRAIRLFLPCAISTLLIVFLVRVGAYEWTREFAYDEEYLRNVQEDHYRALDTTSDQIKEWAGMLFDFVHVWDWEAFGGSTGIDVHLWTIPVEFRASMVLFLVVMGSSRVKPVWRVVGLGSLSVFVYRSGRWEVLLFFWGMGLADLDVGRGLHLTKGGLLSGEKEKSLVVGRRSRLFWFGLSVLGLYLMSQPDYGSEETPGWVWLTGLIPSWWKDGYRFWQSAGSMIFVLAVGRSQGWQRVFESKVVQYFGRISYAMYLMHGPVLHTVGYAFERWVWVNVTGIETLRAYNTGFVLASVFVVPIVIWVSDIFWRAVDAPVVRFAKWVEGVCSISE
ncbi:acyltransferase family-domain-containing protein [Cladorrhinum sp. PSN259]|nr:acyltransferase family-domain-containing protein [Cladorrhinum sp. PSN259]